MRKYAALAACTLVLAACSSESGEAEAGPTRLAQADLEKRVAGRYTAEEPGAQVVASCEGGLEAEKGATQDCHMQVGDETADVRVFYTERGEEAVDFTATPFVPADRVAETIATSLAEQGVRVRRIECRAELMGELDATTTCIARPARGEGRIVATVTSVDGLMVNFNYEVVA